MPPKAAVPTTVLKAVEFKGDNDEATLTYKVGDNVLIRGEGSDLPFVARITDIRVPKDHAKRPPNADKTALAVTWYYRPEEVMGGRKAFHGARELLASDHADSASLATVLSKARVLPLSDYLASLPAADGDGGATALPPDLFYTRYRFLVAKVKGGEERPARFEPDRVPVVCACALPFNPDQHYIKCGQCGDACHPGCVGLAPRARQPEGWVCPTCVAGAGAANGGVRAGEATAGGPQTQA